MDTHAKNWTKILTEIEDAFWQRDAMSLGCAGYEKEALRAATKIFTTVLFDLSFQVLEDRGVSFDDKCILAESMGKDVRDIIQKYTGHNSTNFYKE